MTDPSVRFDAETELKDVVEDLFYVAKLLHKAGSFGLAKEAARLGEEVSSLRKRVKS